MLSLIPEPWDQIRATDADLAECRSLLRKLRARLVRLARHDGATLADIAADAGVCWQRVQQWERER